MTRRPRVVLAMRDEALRDSLFSPRLWQRLHELADCDGLVVTDLSARDPLPQLASADVLLTSWGCPWIDTEALDRMPQLRLIAHAAGTVKHHVDPSCWDRGLTVTTAAAANAVPVAEFALAQILLAGKDVLGATHRYASQQKLVRHDGVTVGNYGRTVGIIGASTIGRLVLGRLQTYDLDVVVSDPTLTAAEAEALGATWVELDELMAVSDIVSLHAPVLPSTIGMVGAPQLALLKNGATFINTARGVLVDHDALRAELASGRINALLDVTDPEPLPAGDPLFTLPNVQLTPHIAGSMGTELWRMTALALDEIQRFAAGEAPRYPVSRADLDRMA